MIELPHTCPEEIGWNSTVDYQHLNKVDEILNEVLDTLGGGSVFPLFDLFSGFIQLTTHPDTTPLTTFGTPSGLHEWLRMPQGATGAPAWFILVTKFVTVDDVISSGDWPVNHLATLAIFFA